MYMFHNLLKQYGIWIGGVVIIPENANLLTYYTMMYPRDNMNLKKEAFESLKNATNLNELQLRRLINIKFSSLSDYLDVEIPSVKTLQLSGDSRDKKQSVLRDLKGIELFTGLESLTINYTSANLDISAIKNCSSLTNVQFTYCNINSLNRIQKLTNLKKLKINNNNITSLKPLENLKKLTSLNLENNAIADTSSYIDTDGSTKTYRNIDILANLNSKRNGKLTELYLAGNDNIIDYSPVSSLNWSNKSGF